MFSSFNFCFRKSLSVSCLEAFGYNLSPPSCDGWHLAGQSPNSFSMSLFLFARTPLHPHPHLWIISGNSVYCFPSYLFLCVTDQGMGPVHQPPVGKKWVATSRGFSLTRMQFLYLLLQSPARLFIDAHPRDGLCHAATVTRGICCSLVGGTVWKENDYNKIDIFLLRYRPTKAGNNCLF